MQIRSMTAGDIASATALWEVCGLTRPWNDPEADIRFALEAPCATGLIGFEDGAAIAGLLAGHDGHRGSVYYVGVHPKHRGRGFGASIMHAAEDWLRSQGVSKLNLLVRQCNEGALNFYGSLGYEDQQNISLGKRLDGRPDRAG